MLVCSARAVIPISALRALTRYETLLYATTLRGPSIIYTHSSTNVYKGHECSRSRVCAGGRDGCLRALRAIAEENRLQRDGGSEGAKAEVYFIRSTILSQLLRAPRVMPRTRRRDFLSRVKSHECARPHGRTHQRFAVSLSFLPRSNYASRYAGAVSFFARLNGASLAAEAL